MREGSGPGALGLFGELDAGEVEVHLRRAEVGVTGPTHHRETAFTGRGVRVLSPLLSAEPTVCAWFG